MMTQFKLFEGKKYPKVGDYVICELELYNSDAKEQATKFLNNSIGRIVDDEDAQVDFVSRIKIKSYKIEFFNVPSDVQREYFTTYSNTFPIYNSWVVFGDIRYWSEDKKELERILTERRFDL